MKKQLRQLILGFTIVLVINLFIPPDFNIKVWRTKQQETHSISKHEIALSPALHQAQIPHLSLQVSAPGFYVRGRHLYTRDGEKVVLRGVNRMAVWAEPTGTFSLPQIEKTGANVVRIMWGDRKTS